MKCLSLLILGLLALSSVTLADTVLLKDGTKLEGEIKRSADMYIVKGASGEVTNVPVEKVLSIEIHPAVTGDAVMGRLQSLRRAADNMTDIRQILDRYRTFIDQNPNSPAAVSAEKDAKIWQDRLDRGLVKVSDKWMSLDERDAMRSRTIDVALMLHDMLKQGRLKESTAIMEKQLVVDPQNASLQYLHGVMQYEQEFIPVSRKSFESVISTAPDHAPTLNNLGVILWRQHALIAALGYYDRAMLAAPVTREILDNVAEALNALPKEMRENIVTKKVVRHFKEQDEALQKKMGEHGQYRWGSTWVNEKELKKLKDDEKLVNDQIKDMQTVFDAVSKRIADLDQQIANLTNQMNLLSAQTYAPGPGGTSIRLPFPPAYFTLGQQVGALKAERASRSDELEELRKSARKAQAQLPAPRYLGQQKIIDFDGMPLPAGFHLPAPPAATEPAPVPAPPVTQPAIQPPATVPPATQPAAPAAAK